MIIPQKLPIGIQDFESLRKDGYVYVDKTEYICRLIDTGRYYFLSRPRRFGKSLLLTTLKTYFEGKREAFDGLFIDKKEDVEWQERAVLYLDFNTNRYNEVSVLQKKLEESLKEWEKTYSAEERSDLPLGMRFEAVIKAAYETTGHRVAILVDEYDKPMLQAIDDEELLGEYRSMLKGFYGALKSMDGYIKFAMVTGVTKFSKISVFSDLNNLMDITLDIRYSSICGISDEELAVYFSDDIRILADANGMTEEECMAELCRRYDGYHFHQDASGVYNPFSLLNTLAKKEFASYWFETGTPTYLVTLLQRNDNNLEQLENTHTDAATLSSINDNSTDPIPILYQSGYLTIKGYDKEFDIYKLGYPNAEVEEGFMRFLIPYYTSIEQSNSVFQIQQFVKEIRNGECEAFIARLKSFFADTPYEIVKNLENHYQNVLFIIFRLVGFYTRAEYHTSYGRIDLLVESNAYRYVMEFKLDGTAEEALAQIKSKDYALPFACDAKKTYLVGINFSAETRNIEHYVVAQANVKS